MFCLCLSLQRYQPAVCQKWSIINSSAYRNYSSQSPIKGHQRQHIIQGTHKTLNLNNKHLVKHFDIILHNEYSTVTPLGCWYQCMKYKHGVKVMTSSVPAVSTKLGIVSQERCEQLFSCSIVKAPHFCSLKHVFCLLLLHFERHCSKWCMCRDWHLKAVFTFICWTAIDVLFERSGQ